MQIINLPNYLIENLAVAPSQRRELLEAIQTLPIPLAAVLSLHIAASLNGAQIASLLRISPQAVSKRKKIAEEMVGQIVRA